MLARGAVSIRGARTWVIQRFQVISCGSHSCIAWTIDLNKMNAASCEVTGHLDVLIHFRLPESMARTSNEDIFERRFREGDRRDLIWKRRDDITQEFVSRFVLDP